MRPFHTAGVASMHPPRSTDQSSGGRHRRVGHVEGVEVAFQAVADEEHVVDDDRAAPRRARQRPLPEHGAGVLVEADEPATGAGDDHDVADAPPGVP